MKLVIRILINAVALVVAAYIVPGINLTGEIVSLIIVAIVFGLVNAFIRPIVKLLTLPISVLTLGLFTLVINTFMLLLTGWFTGGLDFEGGLLQSFFAAFLASIVISIVSAVLSWFLPD